MENAGKMLKSWVVRRYSVSFQDVLDNFAMEGDATTKWQVLFLACMILVGTFYAFDAPAALNIPLMEYLGIGYDEWQFKLNLLYSAYSLPNTIIPFISGGYIASYGVSTVLLTVSSLVIVGQVIFSFGLSLKSYPLLLLGRIIFGIGGESVSVCQSCIVALWFGSSSQISFALGLTVSIARFGSALNSICSPRIERALGVQTAIWTATILCLLSFICSIVLVWITAKRETGYVRIGGTDNDSVERPLIRSRSPSVLLLSRSSSISIRSGTSESMISDTQTILTTVNSLRKEFWMICLLCILLYGTIIPFNNTASDFLMEKWYHNDTVTAGNVMAIPESISTFMVPFSGYYIDAYGHKVLLLLACSILVTLVHLVLGLIEGSSPVLPMCVLGISYSVYGAAIWGAIADVSRPRLSEPDSGSGTDFTKLEESASKSLGAAYGLSTSLYNGSLVVLPLIAAEIRVQSGGFLWVEMFFAFLGFLGILSSILLYYMDNANGGILEEGSVVSSRIRRSDDTIDSEASNSNASTLYE
ncbi:MFS general substrate transporter [Rhizoclosmatium globosum]|uniref:Lysosomal dipeptide transporter MFSD1 n=1 Tax=Rhizoclosmatium globosum TaxID=329046 RepID=A0A1Y2BSR5_9FUNG|nr:MFS general substrate transporter [Rhizoclosmatium globosum]|eukprot:ORY37783.1 MFS general substrate transporter [Rhizoclosmatium globosum]